jgi:hypothetical protein
LKFQSAKLSLEIVLFFSKTMQRRNWEHVDDGMHLAARYSTFSVNLNSVTVIHHAVWELRIPFGTIKRELPSQNELKLSGMTGSMFLNSN